MNKEDNPLFSYAYLDSQRLKETFFSAPKKKKKKDFLRRNLIIAITSICLLILIAGITIFLHHYQVITISRFGTQLEKNSVSLIHNDIVASLSFSGSDKRLMQRHASFIHFAMPPQEKAGLLIELKNPINIKSQKLLVYLKKSTMPLKLGVVVRDSNFFSNSLHPVLVDVNDGSGHEYTKTPIDFGTNIQNANAGQITQLQLYFYPDEKKSSVKKDFPTERWVILKELLLIKSIQNSSAQ